MAQTLDYTKIFSTYQSDSGDEFILLNSSVAFPEDKTLNIYDTMYINANIPWTVLSWQLYGTIDHWWILSSLNRDDSYFYAKDGQQITFIKKEHLDDVLFSIKQKM